MKLPQKSIFVAILTLISGAIFAGCGSGPGSQMNSLGTSNAQHRASPLSVSTVVGIKNTWSSTITGSGSAQCWTTSSPFPAVPAATLSKPITLIYNNSCVFVSVLPITYGPPNGSTQTLCTFNVSYNGTSFNYGVDNGTLTKCTATPSPISPYDEILTYVLIPPDAKHMRHHV